MTPQERIDRLDQRRRYLEKRVQIKQAMGWEFQYDESERDALAWILKCHEMTSMYLKMQGDDEA